jgi:hypothetical protein
VPVTFVVLSKSPNEQVLYIDVASQDDTASKFAHAEFFGSAGL